MAWFSLRYGPPVLSKHLSNGQSSHLATSTTTRAANNAFELQYGPWHDPQIKKIVRKIRAYYFPVISHTTTKKSKQDEGFPLGKALEMVMAHARQLKSAPEKAEIDLIFEAKCRLAGENANGLRGVVLLPKPLPSETRILVICGEDQRERARLAGATYVGGGELVTDILEGNLVFDRCIATTDQIAMLAKLARVLGPKGLMPNIKTGTLTSDAEGAVRLALCNSPFKIDKESALFKLSFARSSFAESDAKSNLRCILDYLQTHNKTVEDGRFIEMARLIAGERVVPIAQSEYGQTSGPKFMVALEKLRAQVAARKATLLVDQPSKDLK